MAKESTNRLSHCIRRDRGCCHAHHTLNRKKPDLRPLLLHHKRNMHTSSPTGTNEASSIRSDSEHIPGLTTDTTATNNTEGPLTPGQQDPAETRYDDGSAINSSPPSIHRGEPHSGSLETRQTAEVVRETNWEENPPGTPTPSASNIQPGHISALGLLDRAGGDRQEVEMETDAGDEVHSEQG